jgi:hypothetical protein
MGHAMTHPVVRYLLTFLFASVFAFLIVWARPCP